MTSPGLRARYLNDAVTTASPGQLLVMLYDRLVLDLVRAEDALGNEQHEEASKQLLHAQEIIFELQASLDRSAWAGAAGLASLYGFLVTELVGANITRNPERVTSCRKLVEPLRDAWREAAQTAGNPQSSAAVA